MSAIPILLCGRSATIGRPVAQGLLPDYEVIHFMTNPTTAKSDIPAILSGQRPATETDDPAVGSANFSARPRVVVLGRAFEPADVEEIRKACEERKGEVAWVLGDPKVGPPKGPPGPGYAAKSLEEVKGVLGGWRERGEKKGELLYW
ncbi:hypothetical protein K461DRAFT_279724 [Myriangium duriaei CBS 260.36]|uniref:NAD(P)-binding domain-containing protein n=1 Tax=Myriangium duriaei CBS 260.36 TaxID=1168546 RepID=A0A9P4MFC9_9PEZI|nr:hypothetical protein K461DRAFT_279724 [Myriangium duriaei CBS 260.36]